MEASVPYVLKHEISVNGPRRECHLVGLLDTGQDQWETEIGSPIVRSDPSLTNNGPNRGSPRTPGLTTPDDGPARQASLVLSTAPPASAAAADEPVWHLRAATWAEQVARVGVRRGGQARARPGFDCCKDGSRVADQS